MNLVEFLNQIWTQILQVTAIFVTPDWGFLISLLPVFVLLGLVGPFLTGLVLGTGAYLVSKPRTKVAFEEGPRVAEIGPGGEPGLPGRASPLPARRARLSRRAPTLRALPRRARGHLPDVRSRPLGAHRHLHELRSRPQGQDPAPWPSGRRPDPSPAALPPPDPRSSSHAPPLVEPLLARRDPRRTGLRRPRGPRGDAGQRPARCQAWPRARAPSRQPAYAGVVTGSFVTEQTRVPRRAGLDTYASPSPLSRAAIGLTFLAFLSLGGVDAGARHRRRARAVGQPVRVQRGLRLLDARRLPVPPAALPDPLDRLHPGRRRPGHPALRLEPAGRDPAARAGAPERAAADHPRRHGGHSRTASSRRASRPASATSSRARATGSPGCRRTRSSTRSPTGRSSSASRSSRR